MRGQEDLECPFWMPQVCQQGQRSHDQEREGGQEGKPVGRLDLLDIEHPLQRGQNEGPGHQTGHVGINDNQDAPVQFDLVRVYVTRDLFQNQVQLLVELFQR